MVQILSVFPYTHHTRHTVCRSTATTQRDPRAL